MLCGRFKSGLLDRLCFIYVCVEGGPCRDRSDKE
ncbi:putative signal peptide protein [Puccinia sorghi]|uniref:Putative signal peptide protein n=1 Tax=Puccinia sorghi TaxID=27349 RepID=A0A0L6VCX1_9BASI|nr:putative signal peptide protein [Puccinia sorghi]